MQRRKKHIQCNNLKFKWAQWTIEFGTYCERLYFQRGPRDEMNEKYIRDPWMCTNWKSSAVTLLNLKITKWNRYGTTLPCNCATLRRITCLFFQAVRPERIPLLFGNNHNTDFITARPRNTFVRTMFSFQLS